MSESLIRGESGKRARLLPEKLLVRIQPDQLKAEDIALIASHPLVTLNFPHSDLQRWQFACYYLTMQAKSPELLSLRTMIDRYARASSNDLVADVPELLDEVLHV